MSSVQLDANPAVVSGNSSITASVPHPGLMVFLIALLARLVALPFTTLDSGDSLSRVFMSWQWLERPFFITEGVWGPLHFYLIAAALKIWPNPIWAPVALHIALGALIPVVVYRISLELFGSSRAGLLAAVAFAIYPMAILISLEAHPETPFLLCLAVAVLFLIRARRPGATLAQAIAAGVALGLASMIRYEAWMLLPFLGLVLLPRWRQTAAFIGVAMIHPVIWMTGNTIAHGDPLYSFNWASHWELGVMGHETLQGVSFAASRVWQLITITERGLTMPLSAFIALGVIGCLRRRCEQWRWLVPPLGLFLLLVVAAARGSIWVKPAYTSTFGLLLIPFTAAWFASLGIEQWTGRRLAGTALALLAGVGIFTIRPLWQIPHTRWLYSEATGQFQEYQESGTVINLIDRAHSASYDALISDFFGWQPTGYVLLHTKVPPKNSCVANGGSGIPIDTPALAAFLLQHRQGVLVTREGGKLTALLQSQPDGTSRLASVPLRLTNVGTMHWPGAADDVEVGPGTISVVRYAVETASPPPVKVPPSCTMPCPLSFCSM